MEPALPFIEEHFQRGAKRIYVMFGGRMGGMGMSHFHIAESAGIAHESRIFIRDPQLAWFQRGLPSIGDDVHAVARYIERKIEQSGASDVRFVGNCSGGYAAMLFCSLTGQGRAVAFVPQSFISQEKQQAHADPRDPDLLEAMWRHRTDSHIYDLRSWFQEHTPDVAADIYVSTQNAFDMAHANDLIGFRNIRIHEYEKGGHRLIVHLHQAGLLPQILA